MTHTGRLSSTEPNLQNLPVRTPEGLEIRRFLVARPGHVLLDADYSQIELRILAHIANDEQLLSAFAQGEDIHTKTASEVFRVPRGQVTSEMRKYAKAVNFGIVYGISDFSLSQDLGVSRAEAKSYIERYFAAYPGVAAYLKQITVQAAEDGFVRTEMGRIRYVPELASSNANLRAFGARVAMNTPIQGLAADIIKVAMVNTAAQLKQAGLQARLVLQIHDELVVEAPLQEQEQASRILQQEMESAFPLRGGLVSEVIAGENLAALKG